jgi:tetratricopeptide (TPR) repeat protein
LNEQYARAFTDLKAGHRERAFSAFQQLIKSPLNTAGLGYDGLAAIYFEQGELMQAQEAIQKSLTANGPSPISFVTQGDIAFSMGDWEGARTIYRQATQTDTERGWQRAEAYNALGVVLAAAGMDAEARKHFHAVLQADEASVEAYQNLGYLSWKKGKIHEAEQAFHKGLSLQPGDEQLQTLLAMIAARDVSTDFAPTKKNLLVRPFDLGGGNIRRLGAGEIFAWRLAQQLLEAGSLAGSNPGEVLAASAASPSQEPNTAVLGGQENQATFTVSGEIQTFSRRIIVHGQMATVGAETVKRVSYISDREGENLITVSQSFAEKLMQVINEEAGKQ